MKFKITQVERFEGGFLYYLYSKVLFWWSLEKIYFSLDDAKRHIKLENFKAKERVVFEGKDLN